MECFLVIEGVHCQSIRESQDVWSVQPKTSAPDRIHQEMELERKDSAENPMERKFNILVKISSIHLLLNSIQRWKRTFLKLNLVLKNIILVMGKQRTYLNKFPKINKNALSTSNMLMFRMWWAPQGAMNSIVILDVSLTGSNELAHDAILLLDLDNWESGSEVRWA